MKDTDCWEIMYKSGKRTYPSILKIKIVNALAMWNPVREQNPEVQSLEP